MGRLMALVRSIQERHVDLRLSSSAAAAGFWLFMSIIPAGIVIVNLLGVLLDQRVVADALGQLATIFPGTFGQILADRLQEIAAPSPGTGLLDALLVVVCVWTVSTAASEVLETLDRIFDRPPRRWLSKRLRGLVVAVICLVAIGAASLATVVADGSGGRGASTVVELLLIALLVTVLYAAVAHGQVRLSRTAMVSLAVSACLWLLGLGLQAYVSLSANLSRVYGTAGGVIAAMLAAYLGSYALLLGALVSRILTEAARPKELHASPSRLAP